MRFIRLCFGCLCSVFMGVNGQSLRFNHLGIDQGLSQSSVYAVFQDSKGFMWLGTGDGLNKYDGNSVKVYRHADADQPLSNYYTSGIAEDVYGNLWIGSRRGLTRYNYREDRIEHMIPGNDASIQEKWIDVLGEDSRHRIWYWDRNSNFYNFDPVSGSFQHIVIRDSTRVFRQAIMLPDGYIWYNTVDGFGRYDINTGRFDDYHPAFLAPNSTIYINSFAMDDDGMLWITGIKTLLCLNTRTNQMVKTDDRLVKGYEEGFNVVYVFRNTVWLGSEKQGLIAYNKKDETITHYRHDQIQATSLATDIVTAVYADHSDNLWVASEGFGMNVADLKPTKFRLYQMDNGTLKADRFSSNFIRCFYEDALQRLWVGTYRGGINIFDRQSKTNRIILSPHSVSNIVPAGEGYLLASTETGIARIDERTFRTEWVAVKKAGEVFTPLKEMNAFCRTREGVLLVTGIQGLFQGGYVNDHLAALAPADICRGVALGAIFQSSDGRIWIADFQGGFLYVARIKNGRPVLLTRFLQGLNVKCFYEDTVRRVLWMGSENGLIRYELNNGKMIFINEKKGLPNNHVYGLLCDQKGQLWLSTNKGICCYDPQRNTFRNYDAKDGLQSNEFNTFAYYKGRSGEFFFGGVNGFNVFHPDEVKDNPHPPKVALCRLLVNDEETGQFGNPACLKQIELAYSQNTISFDFSSLEFTMHDKNRYEYRLAGTDREWVSSGNKHFARYSNLRPGHYRFMVRASNNDGVWSEATLLCEIRVLYPWWQKWYSVTAFIVLVLLLVYWLIKIVVGRKVEEQKQLLERQKALEEERNRISKDMHDDLGSGLSKIAIMSELLKSSLKDRSEVESVGKISRTANELVDSMSQIIWAMNPENDHIENILGYLRKFSLDFFEDSNIRCELYFPESSSGITLPQSVRRNLFLAIKETFHNILKHSGADRVKVKVELKKDRMVVTISDNGKGFDIGFNRYAGNGLNNMLKRMSSVGGQFTLESQAGEGTVTTLEVPL